MKSLSTALFSIILAFSLCRPSIAFSPSTNLPLTSLESPPKPEGKISKRTLPVLSERTGKEFGSDYKRIKRRYRFLEFFSLGFLLIMAVLVTAYLLDMKRKSEEARKIKAETYKVEELENRRTIRSHFQKLIDGKTIMTAYFEGLEEQITTIPCEIFADGDNLITEELSPYPGKWLAEEGVKVKMEYIYNEVLYSFKTRLLSGPESSKKKLIFRAPELIKYTQRRHYYRVKPPALEPVICIISAENEMRSESVLDLSTGGFSIQSEGTYQQGHTYKDVKLNIPGRKPLKLNSKCVYTVLLDTGGTERFQRVGFEFVSRGVKEEKILMEFVTAVRNHKGAR